MKKAFAISAALTLLCQIMVGSCCLITKMEIEKEDSHQKNDNNNNNFAMDPATEVDNRIAYFMGLEYELTYNGYEIRKTFERHIFHWKEKIEDDFSVYQFYPLEPSSTLFSFMLSQKKDFDTIFNTKDIKLQLFFIKLAQAVRYVGYEKLNEEEENLLCTLPYPIQVIASLYVQTPKRNKPGPFAKLQKRVNKKLIGRNSYNN